MTRADPGGKRRDLDERLVALIEKLRERARIGLGAQGAERCRALRRRLYLLLLGGGAVELDLRIVERRRRGGKLLLDEKAVSDANEILVAAIPFGLGFRLREQFAQRLKATRQVGRQSRGRIVAGRRVFLEIGGDDAAGAARRDLRRRAAHRDVDDEAAFGALDDERATQQGERGVPVAPRVGFRALAGKAISVGVGFAGCRCRLSARDGRARVRIAARPSGFRRN
ncbi:MAG: hypothetical protein V9G24_12765 [Rhodoblastus sp.]